MGYIAYANNDYEQANEYFANVESVDKYEERMGYYKADMQFKSGNFDQAIQEGLAQMPKATAEEKSELSKIIGESYFNLKQYDKALPYLLAYEGKNGKLQRRFLSVRIFLLQQKITVKLFQNLIKSSVEKMQ